MQNNYFFLNQLCKSLEPQLIGARILKCYSQSKDEILFELLTKTDKEFYLKAHLSSKFSCLYFPKNFSRTRKNYADLFTNIVGKKILGINMLNYERGFLLHLEDEYTLFFKLFGNRSNIVLFSKDSVADLFHKKMIKDLELNPESLPDRNIPELTKVLTYQDLKQYCPFLLGVPEYYMSREHWDQLPNAQKADFIQLLIDSLNQGEKFYLTRIKNIIHISMLKTGEILTEFDDPIEAINRFFVTYLKTSELDHLKSDWLSKLNKKASGTESYIRKNRKRLNDLENKLQFGKIGDLIMANLYRIDKGSEVVDLEDFENPEIRIRVKLKPSLTPQKNAENYYRKAKNQGIEIKNLKNNIENKQKELESILTIKSAIDQSNDVKEMKSIIKSISSSTIKTETSSESSPFYQNEIDGFMVLIGKNARGNDALLQKHSTKNDLWLHAKDTQGSHVIIKKKGIQEFPKQVIEKAAQIAAYNSKRKGETLCPVSYTERKYVRKRKGDPPGAVVVDREKVLMVEPSKQV